MKPCDIIEFPASSHDNCFSIRYPTWTMPIMMCQRNFCSAWGNDQNLLFLPGTISNSNSNFPPKKVVKFIKPPSNTIESEIEGGVQALCPILG